MWESDPEDPDREKLNSFPSWSWASCHSKLGVSINDDSTSLIRYTRPDVFPATHDTLNLTNPLTWVLKIEAPFLNLEPGQYTASREYHDFNALDTNMSAVLIYDSTELGHSSGKPNSHPRSKARQIHTKGNSS